ncbi:MULTISPECIES: hypothetical protein [unclassified Meiothermus]|nr:MULTISPECIES: hypothetical protein [unclassified Meiothermus]
MSIAGFAKDNAFELAGGPYLGLGRLRNLQYRHPASPGGLRPWLA